jgi:hypothetical protein
MASVYFVHEGIPLLSHSLNSPPVPKFQPAVCASTLSLELHDTHFHFLYEGTKIYIENILTRCPRVYFTCHIQGQKKRKILKLGAIFIS